MPVEIGTNVVANIIASLLLLSLGAVLAIVLRLPFLYRQRRDLFQFLGINKEGQKYVAYFSTVFVIFGGSVDFKGVPRSFQGPALPENEFIIIQPISELFISPFLDNLPSSLRTWLGNKVHWSFRRILPEFRTSPRDLSMFEPTSLLAVGSQYYNSVGYLYTEKGDPFLKIEEESTEVIIRVKKGLRKDDIFRPRNNHHDDLAIVEKLFDQANQTTVIITAGLGVVGTKGAVQYLIDNWSNLYREFGNQPFAICLRFQDVDKDPQAYKNPVELSKFR